MSSATRFGLAMNIGPTNQERLSAFHLYEKALGAKLLSQSTPPGSDDIHIMMELQGVPILIAPGKAGIAEEKIVLEMRFSDEQAFYQAYEAMAHQAKRASLEGPYPWVDKFALITDAYDIPWALYYNK